MIAFFLNILTKTLHFNRSLLKAFAAFLVVLFYIAPLHASDQTKLLLIHLDAVSFQIVQDEIGKGTLPNFKKYFLEEGHLERAISYYPTKTPFIISNIRSATPSSVGPLVGWEIPVYDEEMPVKFADSFLMMALSKHRIARSNLIYGIPFAHRLNKPALMNTLDLFDDYPVMEFYWYPIDTYGHLYGKDAHRKKLLEFDTVIGKYLSKVAEDVNIIIYSDHGMVFGTPSDIESEIDHLLGDQIKTFSYPSLYLEQPQESAIIAERIVNETALKFAFYKKDERTVKGFSEGSTIQFHYKNGGVSYTYNGSDPFGYYESGYNGEYYTADEWLLFSVDMPYPATPIKVYTFLINPNAGDIVTSFDHNTYPRTIYSKMGNHGGFTSTEVLVPVMVRGPAVEYLGDFEVLWLQELFNEIQDFKFNQSPRREKHYISANKYLRNSASTITTSFSPFYRINFGSDLHYDSGNQISLETIWGRYDLMRSYLTRLWFGAGIDFRKQDTVGMLFLKHEIRIRDFTARTELNTSGFHRFTFGYQVHHALTLEITNLTGLGIRMSL